MTGDAGLVATLLFAVALVAVLLGLWLTWTANRLDRMHHRIDLARASVDAQLLRRSAAALELATSGLLDPARSLLLLDAAHHARHPTPRVAPADVRVAPPDAPGADDADREAAESDLSETLRAVLGDAEEVAGLLADPASAPLLTELAADCRRVGLARRFHNDAVASTRHLRSTRRVRWLRLAGRALPPVTVDLDDDPPDPLGDD